MMDKGMVETWRGIGGKKKGTSWMETSVDGWMDRGIIVGGCKDGWRNEWTDELWCGDRWNDRRMFRWE